MTVELDKLCWPAIICVDDDAELLVARSADSISTKQWLDDAGLAAGCMGSSAADKGLLPLTLIDSSGQSFAIRVNNLDSAAVSVDFVAQERCYTLNEIVGLVQQHASMQGHCCVAKIGAGSIQQAIQMVEHLNQ